MHPKNINSGYTLVELMITVLIVGILAKIAIGAYISHIYRGHRSDGLQTLYTMQLAQERYRLNNSSYGTLAQIWGGTSVSPQGYYDLAITNISASSYTITATAKGTQSNDKQNGTSCSVLSIAINGNNQTQSPAVCFSN